MNKIYRFLWLSFVLVCSGLLFQGCIPVISIFPLHDKESVVLKDDILGDWYMDDKNIKGVSIVKGNSDQKKDLLIEDDDQSNSYVMLITNMDDGIEEWGINIVKIKEDYFINVSCLGDDCDGRLGISVNLFGKLEKNDQFLKIRPIDKEKFMSYVLSRKIKVDYVNYDESTVLLTSSPREMRAMILKVVKKGFDIFDDEPVIELNRKKNNQ